MKYKAGDKVWVKAVIITTDPLDDEFPYDVEIEGECVQALVSEDELKRRLEGE